MRAEVIAIGDEMTTGQRLDTNSRWLSERLGELGVETAFHTTVGDNLADNLAVLQTAAGRADIVVCSGGLGPTADDLTRDALAAAFDRPLELHEAALSHIEQMFARRNRPMPPRNRLQAMFPAGAEEIYNPSGTAPGVMLDVLRDPANVNSTVHLFALPGVPAEMFEMWEQTVRPRIAKIVGNPRVIRHRVLKCFGVGESRMEELIPELIRRHRWPIVGITVHGATISLRITAAGETPEAALASMEPTVAEIHEAVGPMVFGEGEDELQHAVARLLIARGQKLATAESGTAGRLAHWLTETPEPAAFFRGGLVAAPDERFTVDAAARKQVAEGGAIGVQRQFNADYGLAVSPFPVSEKSEITDSFYYALAAPDGAMIVRSSTVAGHPAILKDRAAKQALNLLRLHLLGQEDAPNF